MNQCKDCKWWIEPMLRSFGICHRISLAEYESFIYVESYYKNFQVSSELMTHPDFGCNLFEEKEG